jgi:hypothetical protein
MIMAHTGTPRLRGVGYARLHLACCIEGTLKQFKHCYIEFLVLLFWRTAAILTHEVIALKSGLSAGVGNQPKRAVSGGWVGTSTTGIINEIKGF